MAVSDLWALEMLIAAFAGGAFGAALGALPAFIFCGFMVIAGEAANIAGRALAEAGVGNPAELGALGITGSIAFGPVFGPHIAFAGGAAATAYAAKRGYMDTGFDYHEGKNIAYALGTKPDVLAVGGVFGILGYWLATVSSTFALPWDPIAMGVTISALFHRLVLGYDLIGDPRNGLLNMGPFEDGELRVIGEPATDGGGATDGGRVESDRFLVEPWLPHQYKWANVATLGLVTGLLGAFIAVQTGSPFLGFGISAASLVFLNCGVEKVPVTHHITLTSSTAALAIVPASTASVPLLPALVVGGAMGIVVALFAEVFQRIFYSHGDTHWDPPAAAIVFGTFLVGVLAMAGVFPQSVWVPLP